MSGQGMSRVKETPRNVEPTDNGGPATEVIDLLVRERVLSSLRTLWDQRRILFRAVGVGFLASAMIAFLIPSRYDSTTRLMPPAQAGGLPMAALAEVSGNAAAMIGANLLGLKSSGALFVGVLRSRTVADRLVTRFDLQHVYRVKLAEDAPQELANHTSISEDIKSGIITIRVSDTKPERAQGLARAYVEELDRLTTELTTSAAHRERVFIDQRLKVVKAELDAAANQFSRFASENTTVDIKEQAKAMVEAAATLEGQLVAAKSELSALRQVYTDHNVRVRAVKARIAELQRQFNALAGRQTGAEDTSSADAGPSYPSLRQLPALGVRYADLYRQTKVQETVYETLTKELELAKVQEAREIPTVRVLDLADFPQKKSGPFRSLIIAAGGILSLAVAAAWVLGLSLWRRIDPADPTKLFAVEVFGALRPWTRRQLERGLNWARGMAAVRKRWQQSPTETAKGNAGAEKELRPADPSR